MDYIYMGGLSIRITSVYKCMHIAEYIINTPIGACFVRFGQRGETGCIANKGNYRGNNRAVYNMRGLERHLFTTVFFRLYFFFFFLFVFTARHNQEKPRYVAIHMIYSMAVRPLSTVYKTLSLLDSQYKMLFKDRQTSFLLRTLETDTHNSILANSSIRLFHSQLSPWIRTGGYIFCTYTLPVETYVVWES